MSYRFYGGTRERTIEQDMADIEWLKKHGGKDALLKNAKGVKATNVLTLVLVGIFLFGLGALVVWGIQNLATSGISWQLILFNPITFIALLVGYGWSQCR